MSFAFGLGFSLQLLTLFVLHIFCMARKTGFTVIFSTISFTVGYFLVNCFLSLSLSLSFAKEKLGFVVKTKG
jgi:cytochrome c oxidase subunit IV